MRSLRARESTKTLTKLNFRSDDWDASIKDSNFDKIVEEKEQ